jgi:hypothetical protein
MADKIRPTNGKSGVPREEPIIHPNSYELAAALRNEAVGWVAKGAIWMAALLITIAGTGLWFYAERLIPEIARGVPGGAILAFDRADCPKGWHPYKQAISRVIIGWGSPDKEQKYSVDVHNKALQSHTFAEVGGEETRFKLEDESISTMNSFKTDNTIRTLVEPPPEAIGLTRDARASTDPLHIPGRRLVIVDGDQT